VGGKQGIREERGARSEKKKRERREFSPFEALRGKERGTGNRPKFGISKKSPFSEHETGIAAIVNPARIFCLSTPPKVLLLKTWGACYLRRPRTTTTGGPAAVLGKSSKVLNQGGGCPGVLPR
jgi:hypothetical protein